MFLERRPRVNRPTFARPLAVVLEHHGPEARLQAGVDRPKISLGTRPKKISDIIVILKIQLRFMSTTDQIQARLRPELPPPPEPSRVDRDDREFETVIRPTEGWIAVDWQELLRSHELFATLISRDVMIRYKQTVLGVAWAVIQPLFQMLIFTVIFGRFVGVKTGDVPYAMFVFAGLVPWTFFSNAVNAAGLSLIAQQHLLTKIYFPRLFVPAATAGAYLVDMAIGLALYAVMLPFYGIMPGWGLLAMPPLIVLTFAATLGISFSLAALTILYRDLRFVIPFALQLLMYLSPVIYPMTTLPRSLQLVAALNPIFGIINAFRSSILGTPWDPATLAISMASSAALLVFGIFFFRKTERHFADIA
jgi:lipopolysaccharide transport system permease protein